MIASDPIKPLLKSLQGGGRPHMDFGREAAARAAERLALLPPFAPAAETWARAVVLSKNWTRCAVWLHSASSWKNASNTPERLSRQNRFHTLFHLPNSSEVHAR